MIFPNIELRIVFQDEDAEYDLNENYSASGSCPFSSICVTDVKDRFKAMLLAALWNALRGRRAPCRLRRPRGGRARLEGPRNVASGMRVAANRRGAQIVTSNPQKKQDEKSQPRSRAPSQPRKQSRAAGCETLAGDETPKDSEGGRFGRPASASTGQPPSLLPPAPSSVRPWPGDRRGRRRPLGCASPSRGPRLRDIRRAGGPGRSQLRGRGTLEHPPWLPDALWG